LKLLRNTDSNKVEEDTDHRSSGVGLSVLVSVYVPSFVTNGLIAKLERSHGQIFVSKTLGYLTASMFNDIFLSSPVLAGMA
jgi:hypothetical protein